MRVLRRAETPVKYGSLLNTACTIVGIIHAAVIIRCRNDCDVLFKAKKCAVKPAKLPRIFGYSVHEPVRTGIVKQRSWRYCHNRRLTQLERLPHQSDGAVPGIKGKVD